MAQYGFFIDQSRCIGCNQCTIACMQWHDIAPGPVKWMRVYQWEKGNFPNIVLKALPVMCYHCENPVCVKACPSGALFKENKYGAVLVESDKCEGARQCWKACPYGAPQFERDEAGTAMSKCNMCIERLEKGLKPICVLSCSMRALEFGPLEDLMKMYGHLRRLDEMPKESITKPAAIFKLLDPKKRVIPWDAKRTLQLWQKRNSETGEPLPDTFQKLSDITDAPQEIIGRNRLVLKAKNSKALMYYTTDDE